MELIEKYSSAVGKSYKTALRRILFSIARSPISGFFIGTSFEYLSSFIPVNRLIDNQNVLGFVHPVKSWETHALIVPKKSLRSLGRANLVDPRIQEVLCAVIDGALEISKKTNTDNYSLIVNGGTYQDVPQMHFHLVAGTGKNGSFGISDPFYTSTEGQVLKDNNSVIVHTNKNPRREIDFLITPKNTNATILSEFIMKSMNNRDAFLKVLKMTQQLVQEFNLKAYTLLINTNDTKTSGKIIFHLLSGPEVCSK